MTSEINEGNDALGKYSQDEEHKIDDNESKTPFDYILEGPVDPEDLNNLPKDFYSTSKFIGRSFVDDQEELAHLRGIAAAFFNYRVFSFD